MKRKTNFKNMYLIDTTLYNTLGKQQIRCSKPNNIILKENVSHPTLTQPTIKISREFKQNSPNEHSAPTQTQTRSIGTMSKVPTESKIIQSDMIQTNSSGMMTEPVYMQSQLGTQDRTLEFRTLQPSDRTLQPSDRTLQPTDRILQPTNRTLQPTDRTFQPTDHTFQPSDNTSQIQYNSINDTPTLKYRTPQVEYYTIQPSTLQQTSSHQYIPHTIQPPASSPSSQLQNDTSQLQMMDYDTSNMYNSHLMLPQQRNRLQIIDKNVPLTLPMVNYNTSSPLLTLQAQPSEQPPQSQIMDYTSGKLAIETPSVSEDCNDCAITEYKKYDTTVALSSTQGLPDNILFTCTLCTTDFKSKKSLERHMKNQHGAFNQVEKGSKRKSLEENPNHPKKTKIKEKRKLPISYTPFLK